MAQTIKYIHREWISCVKMLPAKMITVILQIAFI